MRKNIAGPVRDANFMWSWLKQLFARARPAAAVRGAHGERLAADFLRRERGFTLVARNWRHPRDRRLELDLVGLDRGALVFIEVKTRSADALVPGYYAVTRRQKRVLRRAAMAYLGQLERKPRTFRFDIVEVTLDDAGGPPVVRHFENIPLIAKHYAG